MVATMRKHKGEYQGTEKNDEGEEKRRNRRRREGGSKSFCVCSLSKYIRRSSLRAMQPSSKKQEKCKLLSRF